jgi:hypothetical protein
LFVLSLFCVLFVVGSRGGGREEKNGEKMIDRSDRSIDR